MQFRFIHAADIHLGHEQYGLAKRSDDFARAYLEMVHYAADNRVDFVLIAGDLFHHARADAWTLKQAIAGLSILREAGIPVLVVEGNPLEDLACLARVRAVMQAGRWVVREEPS